MRKLVGLTAAILICVNLAACGNQPQNPANTDALPSAQPTATPTANPSEEASIESSLIYDANGIKVTAKSLSSGGLFGPELNVLIENNTDKNLTIQTQNVSVNDFMVSTIFSAEVPAGKKANDAITFEKGDIEAAGIVKIASIEFFLNIFETDTWDDFAYSEKIAIPTSLADSYTQPIDRSGKTVFDEGGVTVISKGINYEGFLGPELILFIENNLDKNITVQAGSVSVNGFAVDPVFSSDVLSGKKIIDEMTIMSTDIEKNKIETISEIELSLIIFDSETFDDIYKPGPITLQFD